MSSFGPVESLQHGVANGPKMGVRSGCGSFLGYAQCSRVTRGGIDEPEVYQWLGCDPSPKHNIVIPTDS